MPDWIKTVLAELAAQKDGIAAAVSILGLIGGVIALYLLWRRTIATTRQANAALKTAEAALHASEAALKQADIATKRHDSQTESDRERRVMDAFAKAMEQLASDKLPTRLGAIYTLERISHDSLRDYWPIMETLAAYLREMAKIPDRQDDEPDHPEDWRSPGADIHAILTVIGRRNEEGRTKFEHDDRTIDLTYLELRLTSFSEGGNFQLVDFSNSDLNQSTFWACDLTRARFVSADLQSASFCAGTKLKETNFGHANLVCAYLGEAELEKNNFHYARLDKAYIAGLDLRSAYNLTQVQIDSAYGDRRTLLPEGLDYPDHWPKEADPSMWRPNDF